MFACEGGKENGVENPLRIKLDFFNFAEDNLSTCVQNCVIKPYETSMQPLKILLPLLALGLKNKTTVSHNHLHFHVDILHNVQKREENKGLFISGSVLKNWEPLFWVIVRILRRKKTPACCTHDCET